MPSLEATPSSTSAAASERGLLRPAAGERELVLGDELRRGEQVDDELDRLVHAVRRGQRLAGLPGLGHADAKRRKRRFPLGAHGVWEVADVTNPSNELSAAGAPSLRPFEVAGL